MHIAGREEELVSDTTYCTLLHYYTRLLLERADPLVHLSHSNSTTVCSLSRCVRAQRNGVEQQLGPGSLNEFETELLARALPELKAQISRGEQFALEHLGELERRKLSSY